MAEKTPERLFDYFALEASEQLSILEEEASRDTQPDAARFVVAARRFTSSANMARLTSLAEISASIEQIVRNMIRNEIPWTPELRDAVMEGLRELRVSVARVKDLDEDDYARLRRRSKEVLRFTSEEPIVGPVPVAQLFYNGAGPHIVRLATPRSVPKAPSNSVIGRSRELKDLLDASIARLGGSAATTARPISQPTNVVPIEKLLYRGRSALDRARTISSIARAENRIPDLQEMNELYDLMDLAATEGP